MFLQTRYDRDVFALVAVYTFYEDFCCSFSLRLSLFNSSCFGFLFRRILLGAFLGVDGER